MIGFTILITIVVITIIAMYTQVLVSMIQSIRYDRLDKVLDIVTFALMTIVIVSSILIMFDI
ncbi:membrane protein [Staphylococcus phage vB_SauM-T-SE-E1]|nr:membrane protein [Staphylococcus phage vB_SauM-V1SA15]